MLKAWRVKYNYSGREINRKFIEERQDTHRFWRVNQIFACFCEKTTAILAAFCDFVLQGSVV